MTDQRDKILSYHRVEYANGDRESIKLSACIREAANKRTTAESRSVRRAGNQTIRLAKLKNVEHGGVLLHLTVDTPGETASVVPKITPGTDEIQVSTTHAPDNFEFMDGDAFLYVKGNDVCLCTTTLRVGSVRFFLQEFFEAAKIRRDAWSLDLVNALDTRKLALLHRFGVREIELKASFYNASSEYIKRKEKAIGVFLLISKHLKSVLGKEHDVTPDALQVSLKLKVDSRFHGVALGRKRLEALAENIVSNEEHDDDYTITLKNGEKIKPSEVYVRRIDQIDSKGKSVDRDHAWEKLEEYYHSLNGTGVLGQ